MDENSDSKNTSLSRRDLLNLGKLFSGALAYNSVVPIPWKESLEESENSSSLVPRIETKFGKYQPMYESHLNRTLLDDLKQAPKTSVLYQEGNVNWDWLDFKSLKINSKGVSVEKTDTVGYLFSKNISVIYENDVLKGPFLNKTVVLRALEATGGLALFFKKVSAFKKDANEKTGKDVIKAGILNLWTSAGVGLIVSDSVIESFSSIPDNHPLNNILRNMSAGLETLHPEDLETFWRNILITRQLKTAGINLSSTDGQTDFAVSLGGAHSNIETLLSAENEFDNCTLVLLNIYPDWLLKKIVEDNTESGMSKKEAIARMTTTHIYKPKEIIDTGQFGFELHEFRDNDLADYLLRRIEN